MKGTPRGNQPPRASPQGQRGPGAQPTNQRPGNPAGRAPQHNQPPQGAHNQQSQPNHAGGQPQQQSQQQATNQQAVNARPPLAERRPDAPPAEATEASQGTVEGAKQEEPENPEEVYDSRRLVEHPLKIEWQFWTDNLQSQGAKGFNNYDDKILHFGKVSTIEEFWGALNNMPKASQFPAPSNLQFFKKGIPPLWEAEANIKGAEWVFTIKKPDVLDRGWRNILMALIGGHLEDKDQICGVALARRNKADRIVLWTRVTKDSEDKASTDYMLNLKTSVMALLEVPETSVDYKNHQSTVESHTSAPSHSHPHSHGHQHSHHQHRKGKN